MQNRGDWKAGAVVGFGKLFRLVQRFVDLRTGSRCPLTFFSFCLTRPSVSDRIGIGAAIRRAERALPTLMRQ